MKQINNQTFIYTILLILSTVFVLYFTREHYFWSDDYVYILGTKIFTSLNGEALEIKDLILIIWPGNHYVPFFSYYIQFMPDTANHFHYIIILAHSFTSFFVYLICKEINNIKYFPILAGMFYFFNMSIHGLAINYNMLSPHIIVSLTGISSIYFLIKYMKSKNKVLFFLLQILLIFITIFNIESSFFFVIIIYFLIIFFPSKLKKKVFLFLFNSVPIILYFTLAFQISGSIHPLLSEKMNLDYSETDIVKNNAEISPNYINRSNFAERNLNNYIIRSSENLANSINIGVYEHLIKEYFSKENKIFLKKNILNNLKLYLILCIILLLVFFLLSLKYFLLKRKDPKFLYILTIYVLIFFVSSIVFFRKDIGMSLAFCSSILLAYIITDIAKVRRILLTLFLLHFFLPSIIYISGGMKYAYGDYNKSLAQDKFFKYEELSKKENINDINFSNLNLDDEFKYYYFYTNFKNYEKELKSLDTKNLNTFNISFVSHKF